MCPAQEGLPHQTQTQQGTALVQGFLQSAGRWVVGACWGQYPGWGDYFLWVADHKEVLHSPRKDLYLFIGNAWDQTATESIDCRVGQRVGQKHIRRDKFSNNSSGKEWKVGTLGQCQWKRYDSHGLQPEVEGPKHDGLLSKAKVSQSIEQQCQLAQSKTTEKGGKELTWTNSEDGERKAGSGWG